MSRRNLTLLLVAIAFCLLCYRRGEHDPYARYILDGYEKIDRFAYDNVPDRELFQGAMNGMVDVLRKRGDEHSAFIAARQAKFFREEINQEISGIGVRLKFEGDPPLLQVGSPPIPGKPADRAGIEAGDAILAIEDFPTTGLTALDFDKVLERMRGKPNEPLELTVLKKGETEPIVLHLVREVMTLDSVRGDRMLPDQSWQYQLEEDPRIALVRVSSFGVKTVDELTTLMPALVADDTQALILDLRNNPGGLLDAAIGTCELFLPAGKVIVETRDRLDHATFVAVSGGNGPYQDIPLVVLVNRNSASASEIVAASLQDHNRAVVIGERSFGKGTVQETLPMQAGDSTLKLTTATFWRPSGKNIHRTTFNRDAALANANGNSHWGVSPDAGLEVETTDDKILAQAKARDQRDTSVEDAAGEVSLENADNGEEAEPEKWNAIPLFIDPEVDLAVAYLQELLDSGDKSAK